MKLSFTKSEILANKGCYSAEQVEALSFINNSEITLIDILESEISIKDKRWFLLNKGNLSLEQKKELAFLLAKDVSEIFNKKYPEDNRVNECLQAIQDFREGKISKYELILKRNAVYDAACADAADAVYDAACASADAACAYDADAADAACAYADAACADAADAADATYSQKLKGTMIRFVEEQQQGIVASEGLTNPPYEVEL